jgi:hypothetical protein
MNDSDLCPMVGFNISGVTSSVEGSQRDGNISDDPASGCGGDSFWSS